MKKTPEQKAFREYGKALGRLEEFRRNHQDQFCVQSQIMRHFWREAHVCCGQKEITNKHVKLIRDAWQKRAACKAWNPPDGRDCPNCFTVATVAASCLVRSAGDTVYGSRERRGNEH